MPNGQTIRLANHLVLAAVVTACAIAVDPVPADAAQPEAYPVFGDALDDPVVRRVLATRLSFDYDQTPLELVRRDLSSKLAVNILIDRRALEDIGLDLNTPLTARLHDLPCDTALYYLLDQLELTWRPLREALLITTPEEEERNLLVRVYPVRDLVAVHHRVLASSPDDAVEVPELAFEHLIYAIEQTVAPDTWACVGGPGQIELFPSSASLVISATYHAHRRIEQLLASLRAARDHQGLAPPAPSEPALAPRPAWLSRPVAGPRPKPRLVYQGVEAWRLLRVHP